MAIDLRQSRVGYSDRCKWYKAVVTGGNALTMNPACAGVFYADEQSPETETMEQIGAVMVRKITTAIKTPDSVDDLKSNDYVSYNGETWIVTGTAKAETNSRSRRFSTNAPIDTIIQLRR